MKFSRDTSDPVPHRGAGLICCLIIFNSQSAVGSAPILKNEPASMSLSSLHGLHETRGRMRFAYPPISKMYR